MSSFAQRMTRKLVSLSRPIFDRHMSRAAIANDLFRKLSEGLAWLSRPCGAREPPALTLVCSKTARAVEWRDFSFTSKTAARFKEEEGEKDPNLETARAHAAKIASELAKETSYEGFAVSVTDEQGNRRGRQLRRP
jgi:hypothetical protein